LLQTLTTAFHDDSKGAKITKNSILVFFVSFVLS